MRIFTVFNHNTIIMETTIKANEINTSLIELKGMYFVYYLINEDKVIYVGCTKNIYARLGSLNPRSKAQGVSI